MKGNGFGDKARCLVEWFQDWNSCEQTIALYSLLSKVSATQARFLSFVLEHSLKNGCDSQELSKLEMQANDSGYLKSLHTSSEEEALSQLLSHLPLLNPGNSDARAEYMKLLPKVMLSSGKELDYLDHCHYVDQCRQLLSLALVHPAFPHDDREALTFWLTQLDTKQKSAPVERQTPSSYPPAPAPHMPPVPPRIRQIETNDDVRLSPTNGRIYIEGDLNHSLPPEMLSSSSDPYTADDKEVQRVFNPSKMAFIPRQPGLFGSRDHHTSPLPSRSEESGSFGERSSTGPRLKDDALQGGNGAISTATGSMEREAGMKDVPAWLKSLRLHKYKALFDDLTYEQMLSMGEEYLESKNVTRGARTKLTLSIRKLVRRPETLQEIEQDMEKHGHLVLCFNEIRQMLQTPIKSYSQTETHTKKKGMDKPSVIEGMGSGDEDEEGMERPRSPQAQHSSSDGGSDLEELLSKKFPQEDLPSHITRAMGKGFSQLMMHTDTNEENLGAYIKLLDAALQHEVFTLDQKKLFFDWKQQCNQTLRVISSKKSSRGGRHYGTAYTMPATPRGTGGTFSPGGGASKSRSLRGGVAMRNGNFLAGKGMPLPGSTRASSTLPRMSARQLQQPIPHSSPSFLRPSSTSFPSAPPPLPPSAPGAGQLTSQSFQTPLTMTSTSSLVSGLPPPLPPRSCDFNEMYMDDLCKRVTDHVLPDDLSDN